MNLSIHGVKYPSTAKLTLLVNPLPFMPRRTLVFLFTISPPLQKKILIKLSCIPNCLPLPSLYLYLCLYLDPCLYLYLGLDVYHCDDGHYDGIDYFGDDLGNGNGTCVHSNTIIIQL